MVLKGRPHSFAKKQWCDVSCFHAKPFPRHRMNKEHHPFQALKDYSDPEVGTTRAKNRTHPVKLPYLNAVGRLKKKNMQVPPWRLQSSLGESSFQYIQFFVLLMLLLLHH